MTNGLDYPHVFLNGNNHFFLLKHIPVHTLNFSWPCDMRAHCACICDCKNVVTKFRFTVKRLADFAVPWILIFADAGTEHSCFIILLSHISLFLL